MSRYRITTWDANSMRRLACVELSTRQVAFRAYEQAVYNALQAFGKLDTQAAHDCMATVERQNDLIPIGEQRSITVSNTGRDIIILHVS